MRPATPGTAVILPSRLDLLKEWQKAVVALYGVFMPNGKIEFVGESEIDKANDAIPLYIEQQEHRYETIEDGSFRLKGKLRDYEMRSEPQVAKDPIIEAGQPNKPKEFIKEYYKVLEFYGIAEGIKSIIKCEVSYILALHTEFPEDSLSRIRSTATRLAQELKQREAAIAEKYHEKNLQTVELGKAFQELDFKILTLIEGFKNLRGDDEATTEFDTLIKNLSAFKEKYEKTSDAKNAYESCMDDRGFFNIFSRLQTVFRERATKYCEENPGTETAEFYEEFKKFAELIDSHYEVFGPNNEAIKADLEECAENWRNEQELFSNIPETLKLLESLKSKLADEKYAKFRPLLDANEDAVFKPQAGAATGSEGSRKTESIEHIITTLADARRENHRLGFDLITAFKPAKDLALELMLARSYVKGGTEVMEQMRKGASKLSPDAPASPDRSA